MDLETIGKQMLEALALQGRVSALETEAASCANQISGAQGDIQGAEGRKINVIEAHRLAERQVEEKDAVVRDTKDKVAAAIAVHKRAEQDLAGAREVRNSYGPDFVKELDKSIEQLVEVKKGIEGKKGKVLAELDEAKKDLEARRGKLSAQGIDLNMATMGRQPRTTVL